MGIARGNRWYSMKKMCLFIMLTYTLTLLPGCSPWPTRFEEVDDHRPRVIDFVYQNYSDTTLCEFAPGDTVVVKAYFAGQAIQSVKWQISFNVYVSVVGQDTALDVEPLPTLNVPLPAARESGFSPEVRYETFAFVIPRDIMQRNKSMLAAAAAFQPVPGLNLDPATVLGFIDTFARLPIEARKLVAGGFYDTLKANGASLTQLLTAQVRLFATVNDVHKIRSDISVRYNHFFQDLNNVKINHNPRINFVGVYKVKGGAKARFQPGDLGANDTTIQLYLNGAGDSAMMGHNVVAGDTVLIDTGYTYYAAVDSGYFGGSSQLDTGVTLRIDSTGKGVTIGNSPEQFYTQWLYDYADPTADTIVLNDRMVLSGTNPVSQLLPPFDPKIRNIRLWIQVYDYFLGERNRPVGSTVREVRPVFRYTQAYIDANKSATPRF
jgi:hypothetical protein